MKRESEKWETKTDKGTERQEAELRGGRGARQGEGQRAEEIQMGVLGFNTSSRCLTLKQTWKGVQILISSVQKTQNQHLALAKIAGDFFSHQCLPEHRHQRVLLPVN